MPELLSDPVNLVVIGLVVVLFAGPSVWSFVAGKVSLFTPDPMRQIKGLKKLKKSLPDDIKPKVDDVCRAIFEEALK